jgi:hypothetical protein
MIRGHLIARQALPLNNQAEDNDELTAEKSAPAQMTWKCT